MSNDGIAGFKDSSERVFSKTQSKRGIVHLVRNIYALCPQEEAKEIIANYKKIYTSSSQEKAEFQLNVFKNKYNDKPKRVVKKQRNLCNI